jgi:DsbC/DsbD-like thiol-disulfide interchange protein
VYDTELTLLATITPPKGASKKLPVGVKLDWLVCRERCVRGGDSIATVIGALSTSEVAEGRLAIKRTRAALPRPLASAGIAIGKAQRRVQGDSLIITLPYTGAGAKGVTDFYPESDDALALNHSAVRVANGSITLPYLLADKHAQITTLRGLIIVGSAGYETSIPF